MKEIICHQFLISEFDIRKSQWGRREQLSGAHVWVNWSMDHLNQGEDVIGTKVANVYSKSTGASERRPTEAELRFLERTFPRDPWRRRRAPRRLPTRVAPCGT